MSLDTTDVPVNGLVNGDLYSFRVYAHNDLGNGPTSNEPSATPATNPDPPTISQEDVTPGDTQIQLVWVAPVNTGGIPILSYTLEWSLDNLMTNILDSKLITNPPDVTYTVTGLSNGITYYFRVISTNDVGDSLTTSDIVSGVPATNPDTPVLNAPTIDDSTVNLTWTAPFNGGSILTGYTLSITDVTDGIDLDDVQLLGTAEDYSASTFENGHEYSFTLVALNIQGPSDPSEPVTATPFGKPDTMAAPIVDDIGDHFVDLSWVQPGLNGSGDITKYTITVTPANAAAYDVVIEDEDVNGDLVLFTTIDLLDNGVLHTFTITATNENNQESDDSLGSTATPFGASNTMAAPIVDDVGNNFVDLSWVQPLLNGSGDITKYTITVTPANAAPYDVVIEDEDVNGDLVLFTTIDLLDNGVLHTFTITATNGFGEESDDSDPVTATPFGKPDTMAAPIVDDVGNNFVDLSWTAPINDSGTIVSYTITVTPANAAAYDVPITGQNGNPPALSTSIDLLDNGVLHTFTITATNSFGEESDDSDPVTATPFGKPDTMAAPIVDDVGNNFVDLSWVAPSNDSGTIVSYTITVTPANAAAYDVPITGQNGNPPALSTSITLLENGVLHTFTITATNSFGEESDDSDPVTATPFGKPNTMAAPTVGDVGNNFVDLSWVAPSNDSGTIVSYTITVTPANAAAYDVPITGQNGNPPALSTSITLLENGVLHTFTITATNSFGAESDDSLGSTATPFGKPNTMAAPTVGDVGNNFVDLSWVAPSNDSGTIVSYTITVTPANAAAYDVPITGQNGNPPATIHIYYTS